MTNRWSIHCVTCDLRAPITRVNYGDAVMRKLAQAVPYLATMVGPMEAAISIVGNLRVDVTEVTGDGEPLAFDIDDLIWCERHAGHDVRAVNEWGDIDGLVRS